MPVKGGHLGSAQAELNSNQLWFHLELGADTCHATG